MADTMKITKDIKFKAVFMDGDDRTITVKNARSDIPQSEITDFKNWLLTTQVVIGDKTGAAFAKFDKVTVITTTDRYLDIA